jgi:hypothetical protein
MSSPHGILGLKLRTLESYVERLTAIERDAESDELPMLAYLVHIAKREAERQVKLAAEGGARGWPDELWRRV